MKKNQVDQQRLLNLQEETKVIEKNYQKKRRRKEKEKKQREELSQQWLAPLLLAITLLVGYLFYTIY